MEKSEERGREGERRTDREVWKEGRERMERETDGE